MNINSLTLQNALLPAAQQSPGGKPATPAVPDNIGSWDRVELSTLGEHEGQHGLPAFGEAFGDLQPVTLTEEQMEALRRARGSNGGRTGYGITL